LRLIFEGVHFVSLIRETEILVMTVGGDEEFARRAQSVGRALLTFC
jgi:hypothetical protein